MTQQLKDYLIGEHIEGSDEFMRFLYKQEYMYQIMEILQRRTGCDHLSYGYGNYNASVCFLYDSRETENELTDKIRKILEKLKIDPYSVYMTYVNKSGSEKDDLQLLANEISLVSPGLLYYFGKDSSPLDKAVKICEDNGKKWPVSHIILKDDLLNADDKNIKKIVSAKLSRMIASKDILKR